MCTNIPVFYIFVDFSHGLALEWNPTQILQATVTPESWWSLCVWYGLLHVAWREKDCQDGHLSMASYHVKCNRLRVTAHRGSFIAFNKQFILPNEISHLCHHCQCVNPAYLSHESQCVNQEREREMSWGGILLPPWTATWAVHFEPSTKTMVTFHLLAILGLLAF